MIEFECYDRLWPILLLLDSMSLWATCSWWPCNEGEPWQVHNKLLLQLPHFCNGICQNNSAINQQFFKTLWSISPMQLPFYQLRCQGITILSISMATNLLKNTWFLCTSTTLLNFAWTSTQFSNTFLIAQSICWSWKFLVFQIFGGTWRCFMGAYVLDI